MHFVFHSFYSTLIRIRVEFLAGVLNHDFIFDEVRPVSLTAVGDEIFWTSYKSMKLSWTSLIAPTTPKNMAIDHPFARRYPPIIRLATITQKTVSHHPCIANRDNGGCSHICIAVSGAQRSCLCPVGMVFQDMRNTTCMEAHSCFFRCGSGECINQAERCDGHKNCADRSDEAGCDEYKQHVTCEHNQFACEDGRKCKCFDN